MGERENLEKMLKSRDLKQTEIDKIKKQWEEIFENRELWRKLSDG
jgi:hypothetical protein|tara:strand:+ start:825 stop:959 length:135 start_codon:yes stop_codon:yes gene_type:complete